MSEPVEIILKLRGERAFASGADKAASGVEKVGEATERAGKKARVATALNRKFHSSLSAIGRTARVGAAVGMGALTAETIKATKGWAEHAAMTRRSRAVIRSTGSAAGVTAKDVEGLTDKIEAQTGVDGDLALSGANLLLTFTNVRNGLGANNKIFDRSTETVVNMSKALGQDTKSSAIQLGKALNDPVKGITALTRVGVSFTKDQQKQITALVKSGHSMKAQKIILGELAKEFPKVKATPFELLQIQVRKLEDALGKQLLPLFNRGVVFLTAFLDQMQTGAGAGGRFAANLMRVRDAAVQAWPEVVKFVRGINFDKIKQSAADLQGPLTRVWSVLKKLGGNENVQKIAMVVGGAALAFVALNKASGGAVGATAKVSLGMLQLTTATVGLVSNIVALRVATTAQTTADNVSVIAKARSRVVTVAQSVATKAYAAVTWLATIATRAWNLALAMNPIGLVILAVVGLIAVVVLAYRKFAWFRAIVAGVWEVLKHTPLGMVIRHFHEIVEVIKSMPSKIASAASGMWDGIKNTFRSALNWIIARWNNFSVGLAPVKIAGKTVVPGFHINTPDIPLLANGGTMRSGGSAIVGDAGPELLHLPRAARVEPLGGALDRSDQPIVTKVYLDRRQIAEAVGSYAADRKARR